MTKSWVNANVDRLEGIAHRLAEEAARTGLLADAIQKPNHSHAHVIRDVVAAFLDNPPPAFELLQGCMYAVAAFGLRIAELQKQRIK